MAETESGGSGFTTTLAQPGPAPPSAERRSRKWLIIGAIVLVLVLGIGYLIAGASAAGASTNRADGALTTTIAHQDTVAGTLSQDPFKGIDLSSPTADVSAAKAALALFEPKIAQARALVKADRTALLQARAGLKGSPLTLPEQGILSRDQRRVDAGITAMAYADQAITYYQQQADFLHPFFDTFQGFQGVVKAEQAVDITGTLAQLNATDTSLQKAAKLAKPPAVPIQIVAALENLKSLVTDLKAWLSAAQAHDFATFQKERAALDADSQKLSNYDAAGAVNADKALFQPLSDRYNSEMKVAAGN